MIIHQLKDGTILSDITGHVVKMDDVPLAYSLLEAISKEAAKNCASKDSESQES